MMVSYREGGHGYNDLIPGIQNAQQGREQRPGGTDGHEDFLRFPVFGLCNGPAQVHKPRIGGVVGLSAVQSRLSGGSNWRRGIKFRLSQSQGNAAGSLRRQGAVRPDAAALQLQKVPIQRDHW